MPSSPPLRWGVIGPGVIARKFAAGLANTTSGVLVAAASRDEKRARQFLKDCGVQGQPYGSYQELLEAPEVDAVYIATPHPMHAEWSIKAAQAGKHILCEKPVTLNHAEALAVVEATRAHDVFFMEAFMYRCHPQTARVAQLVRDGAVGEIRHMRGVFAGNIGDKPEGRHLANALGGGGILDIGCYPVSLLRLLAGVAHGKPFLNPHSLKALGHLDAQTGVDTWTCAVMMFDGDILGEAFCAMRVNGGATFEITGTEGKLTLTSPWFCSGELILERPGKERFVELSNVSRDLYAYECEIVARHLAQREAPSPAMSPDDTLGNMETLDRWRTELGFLYESEK